MDEKIDAGRPEPGLPDKGRLFAMLAKRLREDLAAAVASQQAAQAGATHAETRAEGPKDMRSTEASYLARGLAQRVEALSRAAAVIENFKPGEVSDADIVGLGALVLLEDDEAECCAYLIVPVGGGETLELDSTRVRTLTPGSPLGRRLCGSAIGNRVVTPGPGAARDWTVVALR